MENFKSIKVIKLSKGISKLKMYVLFIIIAFSFSSKAIAQEEMSESELIKFVDLVCDKYFFECFFLRKFDSTVSAELIEYSNEFLKIKGRLRYLNMLDIPQTTPYEIEIYFKTKRLYIKKKTLNPFTEEWEWEWEKCSKKIE